MSFFSEAPSNYIDEIYAEDRIKAKKWGDAMLNVSTEEVGDIVLIFLEGELMRESLRDAEETWNEQLSKNPEIIAFNLRGLSQIDSVSINHLFKLSKKAIEKDVEIIIYDINENIKKIFDVIKLSTVIPVMERQKFENDYLRIS